MALRVASVAGTSAGKADNVSGEISLWPGSAGRGAQNCFLPEGSLVGEDAGDTAALLPRSDEGEKVVSCADSSMSNPGSARGSL